MHTLVHFNGNGAGSSKIHDQVPVKEGMQEPEWNGTRNGTKNGLERPLAVFSFEGNVRLTSLLLISFRVLSMQ